MNIERESGGGKRSLAVSGVYEQVREMSEVGLTQAKYT